MKSKIRIFIGIWLAFFLLAAGPAIADRTSEFWLNNGTYLQTNPSSLDLGASSDRIANGYFTNLNVTTCTGCATNTGTSTWATTTSQVSGQALVYTDTDTKLVAIGANSTTSAEFWFDPNAQVGYVSGKLGIGTTSPYTKLGVVGEVVAAYFTGTTTASSTFVNINVSGNASSSVLYAGGGSVRLNGTGATTTNLYVSAVATLGTLAGSIDASLATLFRLPYSAAPTISTNGDVGIDSTSNQFKYQSGAATRVLGNGNIYRSFKYSTTTAWTGTTTLPLGPAFVGETWNGAQCFTDTGTLNVSFYNGTNRMNMFNGSTTVGTVTLSTNNTFVAAEKRYVDIGTPASTPTSISCTVSLSLTAD